MKVKKESVPTPRAMRTDQKSDMKSLSKRVREESHPTYEDTVYDNVNIDNGSCDNYSSSKDNDGPEDVNDNHNDNPHTTNGNSNRQYRCAYISIYMYGFM
jgi:hypothetical protein